MNFENYFKRCVKTNRINIKDNILVPFIKCLKITGKDSLSFINNMSTFYIHKLKNNSSERGLFLNRFGKILTDGYLYKFDDTTLYLLVFEYKMEELFKFLTDHILINDVKVERVEDFRYIALHTNVNDYDTLQDNETDGILQKDIIVKNNVIFGRGFYVSENDSFFIGNIDIISQRNLDIDEETVDYINYIRLKNKIPYVGIDFNNDIFANEIAEWIPIDIGKGCFLGQEYVTRVKFKGKLHKKLVYFSGEKHLIENYTANILRICSSYYDDMKEEICGFGYLNLSLWA